jgi:hypothetical protein
VQEKTVMGDWCDQLLAGLRIPPDSGTGVDDSCATRRWKAEATTLADDGATCVTIWPVDDDRSAQADLDRVLGRACVLPAANDPDGPQRAISQAARRALCEAIAQHGQ